EIRGAQPVIGDAPRCFPRDKVCLVALGQPGKVNDWLAGFVFGPKRLVLALGVVADNAAGSGEYGLGRSIVLFELENSRCRKIPLEVEDVADVCPAPSIDRLIFVADYTQVAATP